MDICDRLRDEVTDEDGRLDAALLDAVAEIERLRLTDAEREAIYRAEARLRTAYVPADEVAATLRGLLGRTK